MLTPPSRSHLSCLSHLAHASVAELSIILLIVTFCWLCPQSSHSLLGGLVGFSPQFEMLQWQHYSIVALFQFMTWHQKVSFLQSFMFPFPYLWMGMSCKPSLPNHSFTTGMLLHQLAHMILFQECLWLPSQGLVALYTCPGHFNGIRAFLGPVHHVSVSVALPGLQKGLVRDPHLCHRAPLLLWLPFGWLPGLLSLEYLQILPF